MNLISFDISDLDEELIESIVSDFPHVIHDYNTLVISLHDFEYLNEELKEHLTILMYQHITI